jgi:hypothetical protein
MNEFIKNLMDPFHNAIDGTNHNDFDSYYDEFYELYGIEKATEKNTVKPLFRQNIFSFRKKGF